MGNMSIVYVANCKIRTSYNCRQSPSLLQVLYFDNYVVVLVMTDKSQNSRLEVNDHLESGNRE